MGLPSAIYTNFCKLRPQRKRYRRNDYGRERKNPVGCHAEASDLLTLIINQCNNTKLNGDSCVVFHDAYL